MARDYTKFQKLKDFPLTKFTEINGVSDSLGRVCEAHRPNRSYLGHVHLQLGGGRGVERAPFRRGQRQDQDLQDTGRTGSITGYTSVVRGHQGRGTYRQI
jgi:hypothetical protein